jgi:hypothetical protein
VGNGLVSSSVYVICSDSDSGSDYIGELSCAECRRLKLKRDKKIPCSSCVRRGCESICPLGTFFL